MVKGKSEYRKDYRQSSRRVCKQRWKGAYPGPRCSILSLAMVIRVSNYTIAISQQTLLPNLSEQRTTMAMAAAGVSTGLTASFAGARRVVLPSAFVSSGVHSSTSSIAFCEGRSALRTVAPRVEWRRKGRVAVRGLFGLGVPELAVIAGVAALVFGPKQLPAIGKSLGKTVKSFQTAAKEFESEISKSRDPETENQSSTAIDETPKEETITSTPIATPKTPDQDSS